MLHEQFNELLIAHFGMPNINHRAAECFGVHPSLVAYWRQGAQPVPAEIERQLCQAIATACYRPGDLPLIWQHWDCRTDLHEAKAIARAVRRGETQEKRAAGFSDHEAARAYKTTRLDAKKKLTT